MTSKTPYRRILLKLSGEAFGATGIDYRCVVQVAEQCRICYENNIQLAIVIGGGNILRGHSAAELGMERATADHMGMLATIINALALQTACEKAGLVTRVQTAIAVQNVAEGYIRRRAIRHLEKGRIVLLAAGTGNPYFTTDTSAALRAVELSCDVILKATKVDGVYDADPHKEPQARRLKEISYMEALQRNLQIMDMTALTLCMENEMPIIVFDIFQKENLAVLLKQNDASDVGTYISPQSKLIYA